MKVIVSACLLGKNCKYNGGNNRNEKVIEFLKDKEIIEVCPEVLAGLGIPRTPIEIVNGVVYDQNGVCVDDKIRGAVKSIIDSLDGCGASMAILKSRSPTCGVKQIYDGTFSGVLIDGSGVLAAELKNAGYIVVDCEDI